MIEATLSLLADKRSWFFDLLLQHVGLSLVAIGLAGVLGLAVGTIIARQKRAAKPTLALVSFAYTIPSIALFGFLIPATGIGDVTAVIALTVYALLPMVRSTYTGLTDIDPAIVEAARGMGSTDSQTLLCVELPLAAPVIVSGVRSMATMTIALAGIASFIGAGGLGVAIYRGITTNNLAMTLAGSLLIALLAIAVDLALAAAEKALTQRRSVGRQRSAGAGRHKLPRWTRAAGATAVCAALVAGGAFALADRWGDQGGVVRIATKPMTEQYILGEMLSTLVERDTDLTVELTQGVGGGTSNIQPGMESGAFDLYPEYTGTGWNAVLKHEETYDESRFDDMQREYEASFNLTWRGMYGFNNTYGLAVSAAAAERYGLRTYSDLAAVAGELSLGAEPDFFDRQDGYPGLQQAYGMAFGATRDMDIGLKYQALFDGQVDAIAVSTTDGQVADGRLVVLEDDRGFYPSYRCGNVVAVDTLERYPQLGEVLDKLDGVIDDKDMARMNNQVETQGREPKAVADEFLTQKGLM